METYKEFLDRISSFEKKKINFGNKYFEINPSVALKVNRDNTFKNFFGDTVVFMLDDGTKNKLAECIDFLYCYAPQCFSERLNPSTLHVTLHDLSNSASLSEIEEETARNEIKVRQLPKLAAEIKFKSKYVFNMVGTSLVLGVYPADGENYLRLTKLYSVFDEIKKLNYPLTPHITLGYYNVNGFDMQSAEALTDAVNRINNKINFEFTVKDLYYQKFSSMNDYTDIIKLI